MTTEDRNAHAREQAKAQYESLTTMLARVDHIQECDGSDPDECNLTDEEICEGLNLVLTTVTDEMREQYHDLEEAEEAIREDPLSVEVRSGWHTPGEEAENEEFRIVLCTGGPAVQIRGELGRWGEADRAWLEFQDWFTSWEEYIPAMSSTLCQYANYFLGQ